MLHDLNISLNVSILSTLGFILVHIMDHK